MSSYYDGFPIRRERMGEGYLVEWDGDIGGCRKDRSYGGGVSLWTIAELDNDYRTVGRKVSVKGTLNDATLSVAVLLADRRLDQMAEEWEEDHER